MIYFVSTPIGNLADVTFRAIEVLKSVDVIACEDTRHSLPFLNRYDIKKRLISYQKFNEAECAEKLIALHAEGKSIAVISDAGTPVLSDPRAVLVGRLLKEDIPYTVVPGANALLPELILSGMRADRFTFIGFLPEKRGKAEQILSAYSSTDGTLVFYCAPHDLNKTAKLLFDCLGSRRAVAVKEITKVFESRFEFTLGDKLDFDERGEFVLLVEGAKQEDFSSLSAKEHIALYLKEGMTKTEAVKRVAKERGEPRSELYKLVIDND